MFNHLIDKLFWRIHKPDMEVEGFSNEERELILGEVAKVENVIPLFRAMLRGDAMRYFNALDEKSRNQIKGEYLRTLALIRGVKGKGKSEKETPKIGGRYA